MSFNNWKYVQWGDIASLEYGKSLKDYRDSEGKVPVFGTNGQIGYTDKPLCNSPGIIIGRKGAYRGVHFSKEPFYVIDTAFYLKPKLNVDLDITYAYYQLLTQNINDIDSGSAIPSTSREDFYNLRLLLPPIEFQKKIAIILSTLDEKIENNLQTNQTLEEITRTLFKEWFVNFNYPNADGNLKHSEFGEIPESWEVGTLGDIYKTTSGGTPSRSKPEYYENGSIGWVKSKELNNSFIIDTEEKITEDALKNSSAKLLPKHSVLIAMYGATVGEIGIITDKFTCNQAICAFLPNEQYPFSFIYNFLLNSKQDIISRAVGSAQQNISQQLLLQYKLIISPSELVQEYHRIVFPLFQKIQDNIEENENLKKLRDSLLPKLMSGEIDVNPSKAQ